MIITVTLNPALDKTAWVDVLRPGELNRLERVRMDMSGKGINVSRVLKALGEDSLATGLMGAGNGAWLLNGLDALGVAHDFTMVPGDNRTNLKLLDAAGCLTELNEPGIRVDEGLLDALLEKLAAKAGPGVLFVLSGSLPQGAGPGTYRRFTAALREKGATLLVDADGPALKQALEVPPQLVKPNRFELLEYFGRPQNTPLAECVALCRRLLRRGVELVALSLGGEGAVFVSGEGALAAEALPVELRSPVGAGDSMVAALVCARQRGLPFEELCRLCMAASGAAVATEGTNPPAKAVVDALLPQVMLREI